MIDVKEGLKTSTSAFAAFAAASSGAAASDASFSANAPAPLPTWDGYYAGASLGASWLNSMQDPTSIALGAQGVRAPNSTGGTNATANAVGWLGGMQLGRNWQHGNFVFGAEGDFSWIGSNTASSSSNFRVGYGGAGAYNAPSASSSQVDALATFRARFGFDFNGTLPYLTAGFALGHMKNAFSLAAYNGTPGGTTAFSAVQTSWVPGVVVGGGIEHQLSRNWSVRGEILWVGFQTKQLNNPFPAVGAAYAAANNAGGAAKFSNDLTLAKLGLNYRF
jgi:outer membrane immunogenic protein